VTFKSATPPSLALLAFYGNRTLTIYVPMGSKPAYEAERQLSIYDIIEMNCVKCDSTPCACPSTCIKCREYEFDCICCTVCDKYPCGCIPAEILTTALESDTPIITLTESTGTIITEELLQIIIESEKVVQFELPNGLTVTIDPEKITDIPESFNLNVGLQVTATACETLNLPANSIVITPAEHGEFGFELSITIPEEKLQGLPANGIRLFHIDEDGKVSTKGRSDRNSDGSMTITIDSASRYVIREFGLGRVKSSGALTNDPDIFDALEIVLYVIDMNSVIKVCSFARIAAQITAKSIEDDEVTIFDALEIVRFVLGVENEIDGS
jgi:hypothetical protein